MKILLVHDYGAPTGGAETQTLRIRQGLIDRGHDVRLLSSSAQLVPGESKADRTTFGTTHNQLQVLSRTLNPPAVAALRTELRAFVPDVVHLRMFLAQLSPAILPLLANTPTIHHVAWYKAICSNGKKMLPNGDLCSFDAGRACWEQGCVTRQTSLMDSAARRILRRFSSTIDAVVALTEVQAQQLRKAGYFGADGRVQIVPNAVDIPSQSAQRAPQPTLGFVGRLVREKGVHVLLDATAQLQKDVPNLVVKIAGDGPERSALEHQTRSLGLTETVTFHGHQPFALTEELLAPAWIQVVPGLWEEPFGNVVTEAMARGTAVVASSLGGPAEIITDGQTGVLVPPNDPAALADALGSLLSDTARLDSLGTRARRDAIDRFHPDILLDNLEALYRSLTPSGDRHDS